MLAAERLNVQLYQVHSMFTTSRIAVDVLLTNLYASMYIWRNNSDFTSKVGKIYIHSFKNDRKHPTLFIQGFNNLICENENCLALCFIHSFTDIGFMFGLFGCIFGKSKFILDVKKTVFDVFMTALFFLKV